MLVLIQRVCYYLKVICTYCIHLFSLVLASDAQKIAVKSIEFKEAQVNVISIIIFTKI